jgi:transposase
VLFFNTRPHQLLTTVREKKIHPLLYTVWSRWLENRPLSYASPNAPTKAGRTIVFIDESGLCERPSVARTWSLRGQTPILQHSFTWKQLSAIAGLSFWQFYFRFFPGAIRFKQVIEFLGALKRQIKQPLLIIWDGAAIHRSRKLTTWLEKLNGHIAVARLAPYVPELNPIEAIWAYLKKNEITHLRLNTIGEVGQFARNRLKSMQKRLPLISDFWKQAELAF